MNGLYKWLQTIFIIIAIIASTLAGYYKIDSRINVFANDLKQMQLKMDEFQAFKDRGNRFTSMDGARLERRIEKLEYFVEHAPPEWFQIAFTEFKEQVCKDVEKLQSEITSLKVEIVSLKSETQNLKQTIKDTGK